jgi:hypothetical protein
MQQKVLFFLSEDAIRTDICRVLQEQGVDMSILPRGMFLHQMSQAGYDDTT